MAANRSRDLCVMACAMCRDREFWRYLQVIDPYQEPWTDAGAKAFILAVCGIESRRDLDRNNGAAKRFHDLVRVPFLIWRESSG